MPDLRLGSLVMEDSGGDSPVVAMIHGLGGTSNSFETLMPAMAGFRVLRPDLPGAGRSPLRPGQPGIAGLAGAVKEALAAAGATRCHLVGHSMGTLICQHLAAEAPQNVASLTLFGPILEPPPAARQALSERGQQAQREGMAGIAEAVSSGSVAAAIRTANPVAKAFVRESLLRQDPAGYASHCRALSEAQIAAHTKIACPTLLIAGELDPVAPVAMGRTLAEKIDGARLEVVAGVAHWMMMEAPARSAELLAAHLNELKAGGGHHG